MANQTLDLRETLLSIVNDMEAKRQGGNLEQNAVLSEMERSLPSNDPTWQEAALTQWQELFRTGLLAWGHNLNNPNPPFFHLTGTGRKALANLSRDPSNPAGYLRHLSRRVADLGPITESYVVEALNCYVAGLYRAAAVMVGAAVERIVFDVRDQVVEHVPGLDGKVVKALNDWKARTVTTALAQVFTARIDPKTHRELWERFDMYWNAFSGQIRTVRNDAGHPSSIDPVTPDSVHASMLIFPELAALAGSLTEWITAEAERR